MSELLVDGLSKVHYVVQIEEGKLPFNGGQYHFYDPSKFVGGMLQSKPHYFEPVEAMVRADCSLVLVCVVNFNFTVFRIGA